MTTELILQIFSGVALVGVIVSLLRDEDNDDNPPDDGMLSRTYGAAGESILPSTTSSLSVVRRLVEENILTWEDYLKYFSLLSFDTK